MKLPRFDFVYLVLVLKSHVNLMGAFQEYPNVIVIVTLLEMQYELSPFVYTEAYFCVVECMKLGVRPFSLLGRNYGFLPLRL